MSSRSPIGSSIRAAAELRAPSRVDRPFEELVSIVGAVRMASEDTTQCLLVAELVEALGN